VDIFTFAERDYLVTVDYLTGYFELDRLPSKAVSDVVYCLRQHFARHGIPVEVVSDNSPFGAAEFKRFAIKYEFRHTTSSPRYAQSNGRAENAVKIAKRIMTKAREAGSDPLLALLEWRNTPSEQLGPSPAQLMFGRRT
jgi:transposase InsO family protein